MFNIDAAFVIVSFIINGKDLGCPLYSGVFAQSKNYGARETAVAK
jgi:hypothetical protein